MSLLSFIKELEIGGVEMEKKDMINRHVCDFFY